MTEFTTIEHPSGHLTILPCTGEPPERNGARLRGDARWYVPYTAVHPETVAGAPSSATWIDVSNHPHAYWYALRNIWAEGKTFAILEHDIVCRPDVIEQFEACPEPWCVFKRDDYCHPECQEAWANQLSLTRFRAEVIAAVPDALSSIPEADRGWLNLCDRIGERLRAAGFTHHWHGPEVHHHRMGRNGAKEEHVSSI